MDIKLYIFSQKKISRNYNIFWERSLNKSSLILLVKYKVMDRKTTQSVESFKCLFKKLGFILQVLPFFKGRKLRVGVEDSTVVKLKNDEILKSRRWKERELRCTSDVEWMRYCDFLKVEAKTKNMTKILMQWFGGGMTLLIEEI